MFYIDKRSFPVSLFVLGKQTKIDASFRSLLFEVKEKIWKKILSLKL